MSRDTDNFKANAADGSMIFGGCTGDISDAQMGELHDITQPWTRTKHGLSEVWQQSFGDDYQNRNKSNWTSIKNRARMFGHVFEAMEKACKAFPSSIIEVGGGSGDNLRAIDMIYERSQSPVKLMSCDPNAMARKAMQDIATAIPGDLSALPYNDGAADLVFTSGVLIHVPPAELSRAMSEIHRVSKRWILSIEYYNNVPEEIPYRGQTGMMWRRDWGEAWLKQFPPLKVLGYGFSWKRTTGLDNTHWFLFEREREQQ